MLTCELHEFYIRAYRAQPFIRLKHVSKSAEIQQQRFGIRAYMFSLDEGSCYVFLTGSNCYEFHKSYGGITLNVFQSYLKTPVSDASLSC